MELTEANGAPRFLPEAAIVSTADSGPESDTSNLYWDDMISSAPHASVYAIATDGLGNVYAGGNRFLAKWDGRSWSPVGGGTIDASVYALAVSGNNVYIGGIIGRLGAVIGNYIAKWDGASWSALGSGTDEVVSCLAVGGSDLYAGGKFGTAGGVSASRIARWDGTSWSALGAGLGERIQAVAVSGSNVYAGGWFPTAGGVSARYIAKWDGASWSALGSGMNGAVYSLAVVGEDVYAGGAFTRAGGIDAKFVAKWNGSSWSALGPGSSSYSACVYALVASGNNLYAGGSFVFPVAGGGTTSFIAKWNGSSWSGFGSGVDNSVSSLGIVGNTLIAGGDFGEAGGKTARCVAEWQPRVDVSEASVSGSPGAMTIGDSPYGFYRPALITGAGTTVSFAGGLPTTVTLDRADEIQVNGKRVNGAFTLSPDEMSFGGDGATIRVEFSEDDVAAYPGRNFSDFRAAKLTRSAAYPSSKEAAGKQVLTGQSTALPVRIENGKQIYGISAPLTQAGGIYGAAPISAEADDCWRLY